MEKKIKKEGRKDYEKIEKKERRQCEKPEQEWTKRLIIPARAKLESRKYIVSNIFIFLKKISSSIKTNLMT